MDLSHLTAEQAVEIGTLCREIVYEDAMQNWDYLKSIVDAYVDGLRGIEEQIYAICNEPGMWPYVLPFDPETGEPWPDEADACEEQPPLMSRRLGQH